MANPLDEAPEPTDPEAGDLEYEPPPELAQQEQRGRGSSALKLAGIVALVLAAGAALLVYRFHHDRKVVADGLSRADAFLRLDTAAGYRQAATLLEPIARMDPIEGASVRAFALAMLFADYRDVAAEEQVESLLVAPGRAEAVPPYAQLAAAAIALGHGEAGTIITAVAHAGDGPWPHAMQARAALLAGNAEAALPAAAAAAEGALPAGFALHGDALRRLGKNPATARAAYEAALAASPNHPRATFGLAKLALSGNIPDEAAESPLRRLIDDRRGTPAPERGRAALHLAALRMRAGDRRGADAALDAAGLEAPARAWARRAALMESENVGPYRAVAGEPPALHSPSDDDPAENPAAFAPAPPAPAATRDAGLKPGARTKRTAGPHKGSLSKRNVKKHRPTKRAPARKRPRRR